jgi:hypothetical protein
MPGKRIPVKEWTDDEWLAVMANPKLPPDSDISLAERWVASQRAKAKKR